MKKSIWQGCLPHGITLEQQFAVAAEAGFQGMQYGVSDIPTEALSIPYKPPASLIKQFLGLVERYRIKIVDLWCEDQWMFPITANDESIRQRTIERTKNTLDICADMGVTSSLLVAGQVNQEHSYKTVWERSQRVLRDDLLPYAEKRGVQLNIETVWNKFMIGPFEFELYFKHMSDHPLLGMHLDVSNVAAWSYPWDWIEILGPRIRQVHIGGVLLDGGFDAKTWVGLRESNFDMRAKVIQPLREAGYEGFLTIDRHLYGPKYPVELVKRMADDLDDLIRADA